MNNLKFELVLLFIFASGNALYFGWPNIYVYVGSYMKLYNDNLTIKEVFGSCLGFFIGIFLGNFIIPHLFFFLGIKKTMIFGAIFYFLNSISYNMFMSLFMLYVNTIFSGIAYQIGIVSINYFLS